jgi:hypothetical protein
MSFFIFRKHPEIQTRGIVSCTDKTKKDFCPLFEVLECTERIASVIVDASVPRATTKRKLSRGNHF